MHTYSRTLVALGAGMMMFIALVVRPLTRDVQRDAPPQTLQDAARIAESQGLYWASDSANGIPLMRLMISETPLTWERASATGLDPTSPRLVGTVAVYARGRMMMEGNYNPACSALWGQLFIFGDPQLILKLTGELPPEAGDRWPLPSQL